MIKSLRTGEPKEDCYFAFSLPEKTKENENGMLSALCSLYRWFLLLYSTGSLLLI
jgi:hypothetical protein